ncbi:TIM barrel protein [Amycolatopsis sp. H6(2020)]|nr:TIM barrel protein [Amycolatopsis sp. H6(2020)]
MRKGNSLYEQGFAWWSFAGEHEEEPALLKEASRIGYRGVDFLPPGLWPAARDCGLEVVLADGHRSLEVGFNDRANHAALHDEVRRSLETAQREGVPWLAVNAGNRGAASDADAVGICAEGLAPLAAEAAEADVGLLLEPLNSKVDHPGNQCDRTSWAVAVVDQVGSPALRVLYDVYHMQIMEGDILRTLARFHDRIGHVHTAGVPGRHELDDRQEINWGAVARTLAELGFEGYVTHEFLPRGDVVEALRAAFAVFAR